MKARIILALAFIASAFTFSGCATTGDYRPAYRAPGSYQTLSPYRGYRPYGSGFGRGFGPGFGRGRGHGGYHGGRHR